MEIIGITDWVSYGFVADGSCKLGLFARYNGSDYHSVVVKYGPFLGGINNIILRSCDGTPPEGYNPMHQRYAYGAAFIRRWRWIMIL